jgi:hypothetical protein
LFWPILNDLSLYYFLENLSAVMVDSEATLWQALADGAQAVLASSAAVLSELQQQLTFDGSTVSTSSSTSSSSSSSGGMRNRVLRRLLNMKEEFMAHLVWSSPLLQVNPGAAGKGVLFPTSQHCQLITRC